MFVRESAGLKFARRRRARRQSLLKTAIRDNNPVLVLEAELLYSSKGMVEPPDVELLIPLGGSGSETRGSDVLIICYAQTVPLALAAPKNSKMRTSGGDCRFRSIKRSTKRRFIIPSQKPIAR